MSNVSFSFDDLDREVMSTLCKRTGLPRTELLRRLLHGYAAGKLVAPHLPPISPPVIEAVEMYKEMRGDIDDDA